MNGGKGRQDEDKAAKLRRNRNPPVYNYKLLQQAKQKLGSELKKLT